LTNPPPHCIVIVGPTAVGKTAFAIEVAASLHTRIISADSRQCYRELNIGVGKPSPAQLEAVKHYFINSHTIHEEVHAAIFEQYALAAAAEIFLNNNIAVVAGGTGLYVNAFCNGMDEVPVVVPGIRNNIINSYKEKGLEWLQQQVAENDLEYFNDGEILNPQRLMRTLEVKLSTGRSIRSFHTQQKKERPFTAIKIGLELPRKLLNDQIAQRVDEMVENGLEEEVKNLLPYRNFNALNTVGYKELFAYFDGQSTFSEAINLIKKNTCQYAKRQMTWFKKDAAIKWIAPGNHSEISELLDR
jgi:tRNA dimethylallyltransferase